MGDSVAFNKHVSTCLRPCPTTMRVFARYTYWLAEGRQTTNCKYAIRHVHVCQWEFHGPIGLQKNTCKVHWKTNEIHRHFMNFCILYYHRLLYIVLFKLNCTPAIYNTWKGYHYMREKKPVKPKSWTKRRKYIKALMSADSSWKQTWMKIHDWNGSDTIYLRIKIKLRCW